MSKKSDAFKKMITEGSLKKAAGPSDKLNKKLSEKSANQKSLKKNK